MGLGKKIGVTALMGAYLATNAGCGYAQETKKAPEPIRLEQTLKTDYKTVDDILGDSFEAISSHNYDEKIKEGKSVVLFYSSELVDGGDPVERLAKVFKEVAPEFKERIEFYKFEDDSDPKLAKNGHVGLRKEYGIKGIPYFFFFNEGEKVFEVDGGPREGFTEKWIPQMKEKINKYLK